MADIMTTTINDLNNDCLREVLLNIDVNERMKLRRVCKQWCKVIDDCWREVRKVIILDPVTVDDFMDELPDDIPREFLDDLSDDSDDDEQEVTGTKSTVFVMANDQKLIEGVMKRCGDVVKTLVEYREGANNSGLPAAIKYCTNIEHFIAAVGSKVDDKNVAQLLALNTKLKNLNLGIRFNSTRLCFCKIPTDNLDSLCFHILECDNPLPVILAGQKRVIGRCSSSLKTLAVNHFDDELIKIIGQKMTLERLDLSFHYCIGITHSTLNHIFTLKNLKELSLQCTDVNDVVIMPSNPPVTDNFLMSLVENLPLLKMIDITSPMSVTNKGFKSLATLEKLKKLRITNCPGITDEFLFLFSGLEELDLKDCRTRDKGVIRLLDEADKLRKLNLENSLITNETLIAAVEATKRRENGICLTLYNAGTATTSMALTETSQLLEIINNDHDDDDDDEEDDDDDFY